MLPRLLCKRRMLDIAYLDFEVGKAQIMSSCSAHILEEITIPPSSQLSTERFNN